MINDVSLSPINGTAYKYGSRTAQTLSGTITALDFDPDGPLNNFCNCFVVANMVSLRGDSGGPVYRKVPVTGSGIGMGIVKGCITNYQTDPTTACLNWPAAGYYNYTFYTAIGKALTGTGYQVITGP